MLNSKQHMNLCGRGRRLAFPLAFVGLLILLSALLISTPVNAQPTGYQEYYVLGQEEHIWEAFELIYGDTITSNICSTVSLVATADHQVVYYDHWEDGYEGDLLHPVQTTTEVYTLTVGASLSLTSTQSSGPAINQYVPVGSGRNPADIRYDGGDRIITSGGPVALTHALWPYENSWVGGAWEVYSQQAYLDTYSYRLPIGVDLYQDLYDPVSGVYGDFRNVYLELQAFEDNTTVSVDNSTDVVNLTLDRGQTYSSIGYVNSTSAPSIIINAGTVIHSNKPTQVGLVTGAYAPDGFQGRFLIVLPDQLLGSDYVAPIPTSSSSAAEVYLSNPNDFPITVDAYDSGAQTTFAISPTGYISSVVAYSQQRGSDVPPGSAARFTSQDGAFGIVVCTDSASPTYDWGFAGIPSRYLTRDYYISWAPGTTDLSDNGSPVWVTPLGDDTTFYVDFSPLDATVDQTFSLDVLQQRRIFDPDNDNTGMRVWATGEFAVAWGEDPATAGVSDPYLDLGVTTLPLLQRWLELVLTLEKTAEPTILPPSGGTVTFTLTTEAHAAPLIDLEITDTLPISWTYVPSSTLVTYPGGGVAQLEPTSDEGTLHWDLSTGLHRDEVLTLTFQAQVTTSGSIGTTARDGFEEQTYTGGENWAGDWQEFGDNGPSISGGVSITNAAPFAGDHHLRISNASRGLSRTTDLSDFNIPTLRFMRQLDSVESSDYFYLDIHDGATWTTVLTWTVGVEAGAYHQETVDLTPYADGVGAIRFRSGSDVEASDSLYVDQVEVYDLLATNVNRAQAIGTHEYSGVFFSPADDATVHISPLDLRKSVSQPEAQIGDTLVYTLSYANLSDAITLTNFTLRDALPLQHVSFQAASDGGAYDPASGTITWTLDSLAPGVSDSVTFTATLNDFVEDGTIVENVGYAASDQTEWAGSNMVRTTARAPHVELTKTGPTAAQRGETITYTLTYENSGGTEATQVVIQDTTPVSTTYVPGSLFIMTDGEWIPLSDASDADQGTYISPTLVITPGVTPGTLASGEDGRIRFSAQLPESLPSGSVIRNWAVLDRRLDIPRDSNMAVTRIADLHIDKAAQQTAVGPGGRISYTLTYENASDTITQTQVYLQEPIPDYTQFVSGSAYTTHQTIEYSYDHGASWTTTVPITPVTHIRWHDPEVPPGTQETVGFAVQVNDVLPEATTIQNIAHISSTETAAYLLEWIPSNQVEVGTVDLWLEKSAEPTNVHAGEPISYTLTFGNRGSVDASGAQIRDAVPDGTTYLSGSIWGPGADSSGAPLLTWSPMTLTAGTTSQSAGYIVIADSALAPGTSVTNTATITAPLEMDTSNTATTTIGTSADLVITKESLPSTVGPGVILTYTLVYTNNGPSDAQGVHITDTLPADVTFGGVVSVSPPLAGPTLTLPHLSWYTPTLERESGGSIVFTVTVDLDAGGTLTNTATIGATTPDPTADNNEYRWATAVNLPLTIAKSATDLSGPPLYPEDEIEYQIVVTNTSPYRHDNVVISDPVPTHTVPVNGSVRCSAGAICGESQDLVTATVDSLASQATLTLTFQVRTESDSAGETVVNRAYVLSDQQAFASQTTLVSHTIATSTPTLAFQMWAAPNYSSSPDSWTKYHYQVTNTGSALLTDIEVWDDQLSPLIGAFREPGLSLAPGESHTFQRWWPTGSEDLVNQATATASSPGYPGSLIGTDGEYFDFLEGLSITLDVNAQPDVISTAQVVTYTYQLINTSSDCLKSGVITDSLYGDIVASLSLIPGASYTHVLTQPIITTTSNTAYALGFDRLGSPATAQDGATVVVGTYPRRFYLPLVMKQAH